MALRSCFNGLPTEELVVRHTERERAADRERVAEERHVAVKRQIERAYEDFDRSQARRETAEAMPFRLRQLRRQELAGAEQIEARADTELQRLQAELAQTPPPGDAARREFAVADQVLAERLQLAITAAQVSPPTYIRAELGERASDPVKRKAWDRGVVQIESYIQRNGIKDPTRALGREAKQGAERARQQTVRRRLQEMQRVLGLGQHAAKTRQFRRGMGIGR